MVAVSNLVRRGTRLALATALALTTACSDDAPRASWAALEATTAPDRGAFVHTQTLQPSDWAPAPFPGVAVAALEIVGVDLVGADQPPHALTAAAQDAPTLTYRPFTSAFLEGQGFAPGDYTVVDGAVYLADPTSAWTAHPLTYTATVRRPAPGRVALGNVTSDGWLLAPGETLELAVPDLGAPATLTVGLWSFGSPAALDAAASKAGTAASASTALTLRDAPTRTLPAAPRLTGGFAPERFEVRGATTLTITNDHPLAPLGVATPRVVASASTETPPDLVLFIADTLRGDSLAVGGGDPALMPALNAWAAEGLAFSSARSVSPWTLPSQASMLTGLYPLQHGSTSRLTRLADDLPTVTEQLRAAGYRTAAITDGLFLSAQYGLDRGFETFVEFDQEKALDVTLLTALDEVLAQDDGRPLFLFVQTYYVHAPYVVRPETVAAFPGLFPDPASLGMAEWSFDALGARFGEDPDALDAEDRALLMRGLEALYRGGCHDFDAWFTAFRARLADHGPATIVFTSDHGEAFEEHDSLMHGNAVWEEEVHVPLVVHGPGVEPGVRAAPVSLIDLAPTLAELADVPPAAGWVGASLLGPAPSNPTAAFTSGLSDRHAAPPLAIVDGTLKHHGWRTPTAEEPDAVAGPAHGFTHSFDLAEDPRERRPLADQPTEPARKRFAASLADWLRPRAAPGGVTGTEELAGQLEAMGYTGNQD